MKNYLADGLLDLGPYRDLLKDLKSNKKIINISGIIPEGLGHFFYSLGIHHPGPRLILTYDKDRAEKIYQDLLGLGQDKVHLLGPRQDNFFDIFSRSKDDSYGQIKALHGIVKDQASIVASLDSATDVLMAKDKFQSLIETIDRDSIIDIDDLKEKLVYLGYERMSQVEAKGHFAIRGDIIDIYVPLYHRPIRMELFDVEVDSIRYFDLSSQRSIEDISEFDLVPARDLILTDQEKDSAIEAIDRSLADLDHKDNQVLDICQTKFDNIKDRLGSDLSIENTSLLARFLDKSSYSFLADYIGQDYLVLVDEPRRLDDYEEELEESHQAKFQDLYQVGEVTLAHKNRPCSYKDLVEVLEGRQTITFTNILRDNKYFKPESSYPIKTKATTSYMGRMDIFKEEVQALLDKSYRLIILFQEEDKLKKLKSSLDELKIHAQVKGDLDTDLKKGQVFVHQAGLGSGIDYPDIGLAILSHREIYGQRQKKTKSKRGKPLDFASLVPGDYVVHENHGIGIYQGTEQIEIQDVKRDYIIIHYQGADRLYVPTDQLGLLYKYHGKDKGTKPKINKLDSQEWQRTKAYTKKSIEDMTDELIELYSKRESQRGYAFGPDSPWQGQFEDSFPFKETPGQLESIDQVKADMEKPRPMDRLLCADVGFGKTEVALRAAFKAVMESKQVAFLVPTTILAQQHYQTMVDRFKDFPVNISILSRFRTQKEIKEDLLKLEMGELDIIVGTHRLLSKDVKFKDLGLLIIDEEQRFGVRHKESLKMIKENVDTLTLTATPIPRTLQMSMTGIRDMSTIDEPPEERFPVQTYVAEFNENMVKSAIERELARGGQVFFVYNRVATIDEACRKLQDLVPQARVGVAHGQMSENILEESFMKFLNMDTDVLVTTTIIETGLDIQNANTMIVYDADRFGLSQLYQLRGRVGRSDRLAYAYFTFRESRSLSEIAERRLMAIGEFTEFGSGYQIALRDLEIRGAGNILGAQQHGHINQVGYDFYLHLLENSMMERKGHKPQDINTTSIDINIGAYIPKSYIKDEVQRLEFYKKISTIESDEDYYDLLEESIDRYGDLPKAVENLIEISYIKYLANLKSISTIKGDQDGLEIEFFDPEDINLNKINDILSSYGSNIRLSPKRSDYLAFKPQADLLQDLKELILQL